MIARVLLYCWAALGVPCVLFLVLQVRWQHQNAMIPCLASAMDIVRPGGSQVPVALLAEARHDAELLMSGRDPLHVGAPVMVSDGGSTVYVGPRYTITVWNRLMSIDDISGHKRGFSIGFGAEGATGGTADYEIGHSWFEADKSR